jgi:protein-S-isoprenylcysteine O-methyltransferase Ste14
VSSSTIAAIISATYGGLFLLWLLTLPLARRLAARSPTIPEPAPGAAPKPLRFPLLVSAGALAVFLANIFTMGMFLAAAAVPELEALTESVRIPHPIAVPILGAALFCLNGIWGWFVLLFNPGYTPFFLARKGKIPLAVKGPYALIRRPRYASEAALNVILFLFTGSWIPLIGILGWPAIRRQAMAEEEYLLAAAPETYGRYMARTGRFLPRWKFRKEE